MEPYWHPSHDHLGSKLSGSSCKAVLNSRVASAVLCEIAQQQLQASVKFQGCKCCPLVKLHSSSCKALLNFRVASAVPCEIIWQKLQGSVKFQGCKCWPLLNFPAAVAR